MAVTLKLRAAHQKGWKLSLWHVPEAMALRRHQTAAKKGKKGSLLTTSAPVLSARPGLGLQGHLNLSRPALRRWRPIVKAGSSGRRRNKIMNSAEVSSDVMCPC